MLDSGVNSNKIIKPNVVLLSIDLKLCPSPHTLRQTNTNMTSASTTTLDKSSVSPFSSIQSIYNAGSTDQLTKGNDEKVGWGCRHIFVFMGFLGMVIMYMLRVNLSVAIVDMVKSKPTENRTFVNDTSGQFCPFETDYATVSADEGEFDWDGPTQGMILGCFSWGYIVTQIPGGILAKKYGGKSLFGWGVLISAVLTVLSPVAVRAHYGLFVACRVIEGLAQGVTFPAMHEMLSRWAPPSQRSTFASFVLAGLQLGTVLTMPLSGALAEIPLDNGWPFVFYVPGAIALLWCVAWYFLVFDGPASHPRISEAEKEYILRFLPQNKPEEKVETPWKTILSSVRMWAIVVGDVGQSWGFFMLLTELPLYMKSVLHFDLSSNSTLSALPYLAMWICSNIASWFADYLRSRRKVSTTIVRKSLNSFGFLVPGLLLIGAGYSGCNRALTVTLLTLCLGANGAAYSGFQVNHLDIASNYAGIMMGFSNMAGNTCGFLAPYIVSSITVEGTLSEWRLVFYISAAVYFATNLFFVVFASGEEQDWNRKDFDKSKDNTTVKNGCNGPFYSD